MPGYLTVRQLAQILGLTEESIRNYIHAGVAPKAVKFGKRWMFRYDDVDAWFDSLPVTESPQTGRPAEVLKARKEYHTLMPQI